VDEWAAQGLREFEGKKLVSAVQADLKLETTEEEKKQQEAQTDALKPLTDRMREVLKDHVSEVRSSERLTDSPACLVIPQGGIPAYMERLMRERGRNVPRVKRILELNPTHPLIESLAALHAREPASPRVTEWIELLHDQALLTEGSGLEDPQRFAKQLTSLMQTVAERERSAS